LLSGSGKIKGLSVANPQGFSNNKAIEVGTASLALKPSSVLSSKVLVQSVNVDGPEISFEISLQGNNLKQLLANVESASETEKEPAKAEGTGKKLQVDDFLFKGGKIHLRASTPLGEKSATVSLPEIHLTNLGQGPEGITGAELAKIVLTAIETEAAKVAASAIPDLEKGALYISKEPGKAGTTNVNKATKAKV